MATLAMVARWPCTGPGVSRNPAKESLCKYRVFTSLGSVTSPVEKVWAGRMVPPAAVWNHLLALLMGLPAITTLACSSDKMLITIAMVLSPNKSLNY